jgi:serine/threonine-protein kinase
VRAVFVQIDFRHRHNRLIAQTSIAANFSSEAARWETQYLILQSRFVGGRRARWLKPRTLAAQAIDKHSMATVESTRTSRHNYVSAETSPLVGRLGPWQLVRLLAEGNFTRVYQARPAAPDGPECESSRRSAAYVLKMLRKEFWRDPAAIEMQRREAWVGTKVSHPNLLPVLSASVQEPPFYVVSPLVDGAPLAQIVFDQGPLVVPLALWIARQVAEGLDALFAAVRLIHADVKPANILVSPSGHATLIDFGFAQTPAEASAWATRPLVGTLAYLAPEMLTSTLTAGPRSDIYSLGVTLYEMLTGRRPLESDDPAELATLHREAKPADIRSLRPEVPESVAELVHTMLAKDPLRRSTTAADLSRKLMRLEIDCFAMR